MELPFGPENMDYLDKNLFAPARVFDLDLQLAYNEFSVALEATEENPASATRNTPLAILFPLSL